ncbi:MAG TPA: alpha/beta fold hydrolase [Gemmatimonadaceae bacterium]|nr:alpha/beta fold hydrolase [Gemmatimonadaceae bacterium]
MRTAIDSIHLAYDDQGTGPPVLFVHAFPLDRRMWAAQLNALGAAYRCIVPDLRGFGQSDVAGPFSMERYADDLAALLDALWVRQPVVLVGLSLGGYIAFAFWRRHRSRVRGLVLADTRPGADSAEGMERRRKTIATAREGGAGAVADLLADGMMSARTRQRHPERLAQLRQMMADAPVEGIVGACEAMMARPDSTPLLESIDVPTLVVVGEDDATTPPSEARRMHAAIPASRLEEIPGAGHLSNLERPAAFNCVLVDWLQQIERSGK